MYLAKTHSSILIQVSFEWKLKEEKKKRSKLIQVSFDMLLLNVYLIIDCDAKYLRGQ